MKEGKKMKNEQKVQTEKCSASAKSLSIPNTVLRIKPRVIPLPPSPSPLPLPSSLPPHFHLSKSKYQISSQIIHFHTNRSNITLVIRIFDPNWP